MGGSSVPGVSEEFLSYAGHRLKAGRPSRRSSSADAPHAHPRCASVRRRSKPRNQAEQLHTRDTISRCLARQTSFRSNSLD